MKQKISVENEKIINQIFFFNAYINTLCSSEVFGSNLGFDFLRRKRELQEKALSLSKNSSPKAQKPKIFLIKKVYDKCKDKQSTDISSFSNSQKKRPKRQSRYRGVSRNGKLWQVLIMINRKKTFIGKFNTEEEAAKAYDKAALKYHKEKARTNFYYRGHDSYFT